MKLIIAEKPMLARAITAAIDGTAKAMDGYTIKGDYAIVAAFGHLLTLKEPEDYDANLYGRWTLDALPIYFPDWGKKPGAGKEERLSLIGRLLEEAECVIHAGDPDDEGQYLIDEILEWHGYKGPVLRLSTGDTTEAALKKALDNMKDNAEFVNYGWSAHARSVADIMVGFNFSRYFSLTNSHVKMLTVGRVQTPTLGLVVTRDMAIENHKKLAYYTINADISIAGEKVRTRFEPAKDDEALEDGKLTDEDYVNEIIDELKDKTFENVAVEMKGIVEQPPLPFNLVKLQTYCSNKFGYEPSQVLDITQRLRDNHNAITYNRSDCQYLSEEQYKEAPGTVRQVMDNLKNDAAGKIFARMPIDTNLKSRAFDDRNITAHTAIIPQRKKLDMAKLSEDERNVYLAIVKFYMAQFLAPSSKERTSLEVPFMGGLLKATSTKVVSEGYLKLIRPEKQVDEDTADSENSLSKVAPGTYDASISEASFDAKETKAPPRYTKASLNEDMTRIARYVTDPYAKRLLLEKDKDKKGENGSIGTSATRSSIIDNLEARGFIESKSKQIRSTVLGRELYRILPDELKKPDMTGLWWAVQQQIQDGEAPWTKLTDSVLEMIQKVVKTEYPKVDAYHVPKDMRRGPLLLGACPRCGANVIEGNQGFGCSAFQSGCKFVIWKTSKQSMMKNYEITPDMVHQLLTCEWIEEVRKEYKRPEPGEKVGEQFALDIRTLAREAAAESADPKLRPRFDAAGNRLDAQGNIIPRRRSSETILMKRLYSERTKKTYAGRVYLTDDGYSVGWGIAEIVNEPPKPLGKCPRCGSDILKTRLGYGCSGYKDGCKFAIWKHPKQKMLTNITFNQADAKKFLAGKTVTKKNLVAKDGSLFTAELMMEETPDNPYGPVYRVVKPENEDE